MRAMRKWNGTRAAVLAVGLAMGLVGALLAPAGASVAVPGGVPGAAPDAADPASLSMTASVWSWAARRGRRARSKWSRTAVLPPTP
jgi:hypothetical protein